MKIGVITVLIVDDHPVFCEGLRSLLEGEEDIQCVAYTDDGYEAIRLAEELKPNVAIIDVSMPKMSGIEVAEKIKDKQPSVAIIMLSAYDLEAYVLSSLKVGVAAYLLKNIDLREIPDAIRRVKQGEKVFDPQATRKVISQLSDQNPKKRIVSECFSQRELSILRLAGKGFNNKMIAHELNISERTVQTHFVNMFKKLKVNSRTEAVLYALKGGWLTMDEVS